jgi:two-component system phosphate regulon response regulator PhoB
MAPPRVVIVEDSDAVRDLVAKALQRAGYDALGLRTAEEAVRAFAGSPPHCWVVDYHLPGMSGAEFVRIVRRWPEEPLRGVPIVGLSGRAGSESELLRAGADRFVAKPFREADLVEAVRGAILGPVTP